MSNSEKKIKRPYLAMILSFILPGLGQLYNEQYKKGFILTGFIFVINILASNVDNDAFSIIVENGLEGFQMLENNVKILIMGYSAASVFLTAVAMYDAKLSADKINNDADSKD